MFDIGFSEILVIFILALIVLGPEKLPRVVREVGRWVGRARAMARQFQEQLEDEVDSDRNRTSRRPEPVRPVGGVPAASPSPVVPEHTEPVPSTVGPWQAAASSPEAPTPGGEQSSEPLTPGTHE
ncbi:MAG TPA: Sec-independent protein translocase protein TatB [Steroidobacteraceae bacterium]|jgi:sec-independent protein translocase protein TatB|nr:Sec-independent protein translocase protein TatB [Steroidobacteraceae bacterium]